MGVPIHVYIDLAMMIKLLPASGLSDQTSGVFSKNRLKKQWCDKGRNYIW